jgi:hypothetical protein
MRVAKLSLLCSLGMVFSLALPGSSRSAEPSPWQWDDVPRVVAIGDVHGSYDKLLKLLRGTGLVDDQLAWTGGGTHLVFVGDLVDRGPDDRQVLDLARRLQTEAAAAGGRVHPLLGNHEVMNLSGDLRYVSEKGFRDFLPEEDRKARNQGMQRFRNTVGPGIPLIEIKPAFEKRFPPGYFGRLRAFWYDGEYGSWLLEQPAVIKINGVVFLHGGLTEEVAARGLDSINKQVHEDIRSLIKNAEELVQLTGAPPSYADAMRMAHQLGQASDNSNRTAVARTVLQLSKSLPYVPSGPLWYRGVSNETERLERHSVENSLADLGASTMVVAHTPTASGRINSRFGGQVFRVDVGMAYGREPLALVFEGDETKVYDPMSNSYGPFVVEPSQGEGVAQFSEQLPEEQLLDFLRTAKVIGDCQHEQRGLRYAEICDLEQKDLHLRAVFQTVDEKPGDVKEEPVSMPRTYRNEIASFLIDRLLRINLVPATVERTIDGVPGSLQVWLETAVDIPLLETYDKMELLNPVEDQIIRADAFMAFIDVYAQHKSVGVMLLVHEKQLQIADNTKAFSTSQKLNPEFLTPPCPPIEADRELFLRSITQQDIETAAGKYLSDRQIEALLVRRDLILDICSGPDRSSQPAN